MRCILIFICFFISQIVKGQEPAIGIFPLKDSSIYYEKVINLDSVTKDEIFKRIKFWAVDNITSQKYALQAEDKQEGYIIYRTSFLVPFNNPPIKNLKNTTSSWGFNCILKFLVKDGKAKVSMYDYTMGNESVGFTSILNYKQQSEDLLKGYKMNKKYLDQLFAEARNTFIRMDKQSYDILNQVEKSIKTKPANEF